MIGNLPSETDKDQELHVLNLALGEALIGLLQDASRNSNNDNLGDITTDLLDFDNDVPRQGFSEGGLTTGGPEDGITGGLGGADGTGTGGLDPSITAIGGLAVSVATGASVPSIAFGIANAITAFATGRSIADQLGANLSAFSSPQGLFGQFDVEIENPATGQITTLSGRQAIQDSQRGTPDLSFSPAPPIGFLGTGATNNASTPISVEQAPALAADAAVASDPAADAAVAAGQGVAVGATGTGATGVASESGFGDPGTGVDSGSSSGASTGADDSGHASSGEGLAKDGGQIKGYQEGDLVEDQQADTQLDGLGLGPVGLVDDPDGTTGVADDLDMDLPVNSYVLNEPAVKLAGVVSVNKIIKEAIDLALEDEVDLPAEIKTAEKIPIRISRGEIVIPAPLVDYIGLKKLENMNNRGLKVRKQREAEEAPVEMAAAPSPQQDLLAQIQPVA